MKIISIKWRNGSSDFAHVVTNEDGATAQYKQLKEADTEGLFDIAVFSSDAFDDALDYLKTETQSYIKDTK